MILTGLMLSGFQAKKTVNGYTDPAKWKLVWSDEFNYKGYPDPAIWEYEEAYYRRPIELQPAFKF